MLMYTDKDLSERVMSSEHRGRNNTQRIEDLDKRVTKLEDSATGERLSKVEFISGENKEEVKKVKEDISAFYKMAVNQDALTTTLKTIVSDNKEQLKEFSKTLDNVNSNLTNLNSKSDNMQDDMSRFESELKSVKDSHKALEETGKFDLKNFMFQEAPKYLGLALLAFLLSYFSLQ